MIEKYLRKLNCESKYILDNNNAIIVNRLKKTNNFLYEHLRLVDDKVVVINKWFRQVHILDLYLNNMILRNENLISLDGELDSFNELYNYKTCKFIVEPPTYDYLTIGKGRIDYLNEYDGFLASFKVKSDPYDDDYVSWIDKVTGEDVSYRFLYEEQYFAIVNKDGSIRNNKVFKGNSFSEITAIEDISKFNSLDDFKNYIRRKLNTEKYKEKYKYLYSNEQQPIYKENEVLELIRK